MKITFLPILILLAVAVVSPAQEATPGRSDQLARWLKRFPEADANGDGKLTMDEARAYRAKMTGGKSAGGGRPSGAPRKFSPDPGWDEPEFPEHAVCHRSPEEIRKLYGGVTTFPKPENGALRVVATGHSFMGPGFKALPHICRAAGFEQPFLAHTGGGMTGSARYKWEQENGIFQFDGNPRPKLLASIANAQWEAMMWGPYFNDRPVYYACWIDFCLKYNPGMKFYLSDAWPQLGDLENEPTTEAELTGELLTEMGRAKHATYAKIINQLNAKYPGKVHVLPTCDAMVLSAHAYLRGELPGIEGLHRVLGKKEKSLWRDHLGHLGPGFDRLEGYVFYATLYQRSPELLGEIRFPGKSAFPSPELDQAFRKIAWQAVTNNPLSGVTDTDNDGIGEPLSPGPRED